MSGAMSEREARGAENFDALREGVQDARVALAKVMPPTPDADNPLYYPLLFLTEHVERTLGDVLRSAHAAVKEENRGAAAFLAVAGAPIVNKGILSSNRAIKLDNTEGEVARLQGELAAMPGARDLWKQAYDDLLARHTTAPLPEGQ